MFGTFGTPFDYSSSVTNVRPDVVLIQANSSRLGATVSLERDRPWHRFIDELGDQRLFQVHHLARVRKVWREIRDQVGPRLDLPVTQVTPDGAIQLYWDTGKKYVEVDVYSDGYLDWFFKDRMTGETDGTDEDRVNGVPPHLMARLISIVS